MYPKVINTNLSACLLIFGIALNTCVRVINRFPYQPPPFDKKGLPGSCFSVLCGFVYKLQRFANNCFGLLRAFKLPKQTRADFVLCQVIKD